ncbi:MAG: hypothetical protein JXR15_12575 [Shimia sp.]|uniref:hypothetical protein n=1 Tax=Shimia sp. TaxID=1954381 RepID=UPI003B8BDD36
MSVDWEGVAGEVADALAEVGVQAIIEQPGARSGSESNPTYGPPIEASCSAVQESLSKLKAKGTLVEHTEAAYVVSSKVAPTTADKLKIDGVSRKILRVDAEAPGGVDLLYTVQVKR